MKAVLPWVMWLIILLSLQAFFGSSMEIKDVKPDFFLLFVIYIAMKRGSTNAFFIGLFLGLVQDVLSAGSIGFNILTKPAIGYAAGLFRSKLDFANPNTQTLATFGATLVEGTALAFILYAYHPFNTISSTFSRVILIEAAYNSLLLPLLIHGGRAAGDVLTGFKGMSGNSVE